ncbi:MAG: RNA polymerase sigma factor [Phycisphaerae bacterium]|nr:RNA polymerase sigma factor [Phycisphaerae bacterium]
MEYSDSDNIRASLQGDEKAFERLVLQYQTRVAGLMWRFSRNHSTCERLVQDVFVEVYLSLKTYKARAPFVHWLNKIATRVGYRYWKQLERQKRFVPLDDADFAEIKQLQKIDPDEAAELLHCLLTQLPNADRLVLTLVYFENCTMSEVAQRTGWTRAATKMRAARARKKLKKIAEKQKILEKLEWMQ